MRMLIVEATAGESDDVIADARERGHEVFRCQPSVETVLPCVGVADVAPCPFDGLIDVAIDVHPQSNGLEPRELGLLCAEVAGVPLVVAGHSPVDESASETTVEAAVSAAERAVVDNDLRVPTYALERAARRVLSDLGDLMPPVWASYEEHDGVFDVVIETDALGPIEQAAVDAALLPMFADAMRHGRFGDVVYTSRSEY